MQAVKGRFCGREREPVLFSCVRFGVMSMTRKFFFLGHMLIVYADYVDLFSHVLHYHSLPDLAFQLWPKSLGLQVLQGDS